MKKILKIIGIVILCIGVIALLFIKFWLSLGGRVTEDDQKEYKARNSLYKKGIFHGNPEIQLMTGQKSEYKNEEKVPKGEIPVHQLKKIEKAKNDELKWIWFGYLLITSNRRKERINGSCFFKLYITDSFYWTKTFY